MTATAHAAESAQAMLQGDRGKTGGKKRRGRTTSSTAPALRSAHGSLSPTAASLLALCFDGAMCGCCCTWSSWPLRKSAAASS